MQLSRQIQAQLLALENNEDRSSVTELRSSRALEKSVNQVLGSLHREPRTQTSAGVFVLPSSSERTSDSR
jgi:hypothetical protein